MKEEFILSMLMMMLIGCKGTIALENSSVVIEKILISTAKKQGRLNIPLNYQSKLSYPRDKGGNVEMELEYICCHNNLTFIIYSKPSSCSVNVCLQYRVHFFFRDKDTV